MNKRLTNQNEADKNITAIFKAIGSSLPKYFPEGLGFSVAQEASGSSDQCSCSS